MTSPFLKLFGMKHPIVLAPMGGVAGGRLAAAVTRAGGLGLIGLGYGDPKAGYGSPEWISAQFEEAKGQRVGAGFITWGLAKRPELLDVVLEKGADPIFLSFGDPTPFISKIRKAGRKLILQVGTVEEAKAAIRAQADVIVAQGTEAGGHGTGRRSLFSLLPAVVDVAGSVPVLATGSISDGRGLVAAQALGAQGVLIGTRFFASKEALGTDAVKRRLLEASGDDTLRTRVFDIVRGLGWPAIYTGRAISNRFAETWHGHEAELIRDREAQAERYEQARQAGDLNTAVVFAGEGLDLVNDCPSAEETVAKIVADAAQVSTRLTTPIR